MRWARSRRWIIGWAAVAVALALVGHALLMAGGGHPVSAAASHTLDGRAAADNPRIAHTSHRAARHVADPALPPPVRAGSAPLDVRVPAASHPEGGGPAEDRSGGCGGLLALARPQPLSGSTHILPPLAVALVVLPTAARRAVADRLEPAAPPGTLRALLQVYRI